MFAFSAGGSAALATGGGILANNRFMLESLASLSFLEIGAVSKFFKVGMIEIINYLKLGIDSIGFP